MSIQDELCLKCEHQGVSWFYPGRPPWECPECAANEAAMADMPKWAQENFRTHIEMERREMRRYRIERAGERSTLNPD